MLGNFQLTIFLLYFFGVKKSCLRLFQTEKRICSNKLSFQVRERSNAKVISRIIISLLVNDERNKETEL